MRRIVTRRGAVAHPLRMDYAHRKHWGSDPLMDINVSLLFILAGLLFGAGTALIGFLGLLGAWFHRSLGSPLPLPDLHRASERRLTLWVGVAGFLLWASVFVIGLSISH